MTANSHAGTHVLSKVVAHYWKNGATVRVLPHGKNFFVEKRTAKTDTSARKRYDSRQQ
jgi:hypothetical protein